MKPGIRSQMRENPILQLRDDFPSSHGFPPQQGHKVKQVKLIALL